MRYRGQRHAVLVEFAGAPDEAALRSAFERVYRARFGRSLGEDFAPEIVGLRVIAEGETRRPDLAAISPAAAADSDPRPVAHRPLHGRDGWTEAPVWRRDSLPVGFAIAGPAVIEEYGATTLLSAGDAATIGTLGEITIRVGA
jgi:N-methylhydantoinase A